MWVVAVSTGHLMFWNRVMGELGKLHFDLHVAACAEIFLFVAADFLLRAFVQLVTVEAADIVECVYAGIPTGQIGRGGSAGCAGSSSGDL